MLDSGIGLLADCKDLLGQIQKDFSSLGIVGEVEISTLIYLVGTSRVRKNPLRLIIRGPSGAGKSILVTKVGSMFPPDDVIEATSLTPQALYYFPPGALKHKFLQMGEMSHRTDEESADNGAALRQLISEGKITKQVTINAETVTLSQEGPIALCQTTTRESIFTEDLNRYLQVFVNDSPEQTKKILEAIARESQGEVALDNEVVIERHREFQKSLEDIPVVVPYALGIAQLTPANKLEVRRLFKQILATIETLAFLHQHTRERDDHGRLIANADDYRVARQLLAGPINEAIGHGDKVFNAFHALRNAITTEQFTSTEALSAGGFRNKVSRDKTLKALAEAGLLKCVQVGLGTKPSTWKWTGNTLEHVLPETLPDELRRKCVNKRKSNRLRRKPL